MTNARTTTPGGRGAIGSGGFTLIELLVVVSIILILLGIAVTAYVNITKDTRMQNTRMILRELRDVATDYQARTGANVSQPNSAPFSSSNSIVGFVKQVNLAAPTSAELFQKINAKFKQVDPANNEPGFVDSWGNWIRYCYYDPSGSIQSSIYLNNGLPIRQSQTSGLPYFASAGPDGQWGKISSSGQPDAKAKDNLYSFNLKGHQHENQ